MRLKIAFPVIALLLLSFAACQSDTDDNLLTGNEINFELIPGEVEGNTTTGTLSIKERNDGKAQIEITLNGVINGAVHPVHLHFGSLEANGLVATYLDQIEEKDGVGKSITVLNQFDDETQLLYNDLVSFDGSIKIHYESSGALKDAILGSTNIGVNSAGNAAFLSGQKSITVCNGDFERN